jgi:hypothetical protein
VLVGYDYAAGSTVALPEALKQRLSPSARA